MNSDKATIKKLKDENLRLKNEMVELLKLKNKNKGLIKSIENFSERDNLYTGFSIELDKKISTLAINPAQSIVKNSSTNACKEIIKKLEQENDKLRVEITPLLKYRLENNEPIKKPVNNIQTHLNWQPAFEYLPEKYKSDYKIAKLKSVEVQKDFLKGSITEIKYKLRNKKLEFRNISADNEEEALLNPSKELRIIEDLFKSEFKKLGFEYEENDFRDFLNFYRKLDNELGLIDDKTSNKNFDERKYKEKRDLEFDNFVYGTKKKPPYKYIEVTSLLANGSISKSKPNKYHFQGKTFEEIPDLIGEVEKYLFKDRPKETHFKISNYIEDTLKENGIKNLLGNEQKNRTILKNTVKYNLENDIAVIEEYQNKFDSII